MRGARTLAEREKREILVALSARHFDHITRRAHAPSALGRFAGGGGGGNARKMWKIIFRASASAFCFYETRGWPRTHRGKQVAL